MTATIQDCKNPQLPRYIMGGGMQSQTNQLLNCSANHTVNYSQAAHSMGRLLTVAKGPTVASVAAECIQHGWWCKRGEDAWGTTQH